VKNRSKTANKGMALVIVLLIMFVLVVLTGAFVRVNSSNLQLLSSSINRSRAEEACMSAIQYAWMRLDQDQSWATPGYFTSNPTDEYWPVAKGPNARVQAKGAGTIVTGFIKDSDMRWRIEVTNNLAGETPLGGVVPKRAAKIEITGWSGNSERHATVVLRKKAFVDSSAVSQLNLDIPNGKWNLQSSDPLLNMVRSNATIHAPSAGLGGGASQIEFMKSIYATTSAVGPYGTAWASDDIVVGGMSGKSLGGSPTDRETAGKNAKGTFLPKTGSKYQIPDLQAANLNGPVDERVLPGGKYFFTIAGANIPTIPPVAGVPDTPEVPAVLDPVTGAEITPAVPAVPGTPGKAAVPGFTQWTQSLVYTDPSGKETVLASVLSGTGKEGEITTPVPLSKDVFVPLALDPVTKERTDDSVVANLRTGSISVQPGIKAVVPSGDLVVTGQLGSGNVALGTKVEGSFDEGKDSWKDRKKKWDDDKKDRYGGKERPEEIKVASALELVDGSLNIYGAATGWGSIVSNKDIVLRLKNALSTDPDVGVAIFAGGNVQMLHAVASFGVDTSGASFSGLIYSKGSFTIPDAKGQTLSVEGAVVAKTGGIEVKNAARVDFKYNPDYLYDIIQHVPGTATRLEQVSFSMR
jgi:hypothetical protein